VDDDPEFLVAEAQNTATLVHIEPTDGEWTSFPEIHKKTKEQLILKGYKALFPIQQHSFYPVYMREDLIARDLTGSGKTFAFGLPVVEYLRRHKFLGSRKV
jgi:superfamily II DNA/RNA helicase